MKENLDNYKFCIEVVLDNAKKRINFLDDSNKKCLLEEYKEWMNDDFSEYTVLILREDPII